MFSEYLLCLVIPLTTMIISKLTTKKIFHYSEKCRLEDKNNNNVINQRKYHVQQGMFESFFLEHLLLNS